MQAKIFRNAAAFMLSLCAFCCANLHAQSLSDIEWDKFMGESEGEKVRSHADPFAGGRGTAADDLSIEELQLSGIVFRYDEEAYALISGYLVRPGDRIAGYRVDRIEKNQVRLKRIDEVFILTLGGGI